MAAVFYSNLKLGNLFKFFGLMNERAYKEPSSRAVFHYHQINKYHTAGNITI